MRLFTLAATGIALLMGAVSLFIWLGAERVSPWLAPGFDADNLARTTELIRILIPAALFLGLSALTYITLNA